MQKFFNKNPKSIITMITVIVIIALVVFSGKGIKCDDVTDLSSISCEITNIDNGENENIIHRYEYDQKESIFTIELTKNAKEKYKEQYLAFVIMSVEKGKEKKIDFDDYKNIEIKKLQLPTSEQIEISYKKFSSNIKPYDNIGAFIYLLTNDIDVTNIRTLKELKNKEGKQLTEVWMGVVPNFSDKKHIELFFRSKSNQEKLMIYDYIKNQNKSN